MKIKLQSLILLTLAMSLTACGVKVLKSSKSNGQAQEDITRPPQIKISKQQDTRVASDPNETISYEEWNKKNESPLKSSSKGESDNPDDDLTFEEWKKQNPIDGEEPEK